jgi:hypothetical protein
MKKYNRLLNDLYQTAVTLKYKPIVTYGSGAAGHLA